MPASNAPLNAPLNSPPANDSIRSSTVDTSKGEKPGESDNKATEELSVVIDDLLNQLGNKFSAISEELLGKMDEMSRRLDNLETAIQAGKGNDGK